MANRSRPPARGTRALATGLLAVAAAELAIAAVMALTSGISWAAAVASFTVTNGAMGLGFAVCGVLLAWHRPGNPVGWLFMAAALADAMSAAAIQLTGFGAERLLVIPLIPAAVTVAIMRYQLLDIRLVFSRTLAYAIVTGVLAGVYAGLVLLATWAVPFSAPVAVATSTLTCAALFTPLRQRTKNIVDHRFNRARYDADQAVAAFAGRLQDAVDLDAVSADLTAAVQAALEPAHLSVWMSRPPHSSR